MIKEGILIYDLRQNRYDIKFGGNDFYGGLHCGTIFNVCIDDKWYNTRIEYSFKKNSWYLVGFNDLSLIGLKVKISELTII